VTAPIYMLGLARNKNYWRKKTRNKWLRLIKIGGNELQISLGKLYSTPKNLSVLVH